MRPRLFRPLTCLTLGAGILLGLTGCQTLEDRPPANVAPSQGSEHITGLAQAVSIRRNALGMPLIETSTFHDALFAEGYLHASDRLSQMVRMRLLAQGRLSERVGPGALEIDRFMRAVNLRARADAVYQSASPRMKTFLDVYARGVNAYIYRYRDTLPTDLAEAGYRPEYWKPEDSALLFCLLNFGLQTNLQEEIAALVLAQKVGVDQLAWLLPVYPDEPLPFDEAAKLKGLDLTGQLPGLAALQAAAGAVAGLNMLGVAASNNWAIAAQNSRSGRSLFANDTHLPLSLPSLWNFVQIRAPKYEAAGVSVAGLPGVVAGFNGKLAWGMSMVMGDNQDLFLEQLRRDGSQLKYLADGQWQPLRERQETFFIKGQRPVRETFYETRHGPLLNSALGEHRPLDSGYGLALQMPSLDDDRSLDALFDLSRAQSVEQAFEQAREIHASALNLVFADARHIGWQVTGRYPNRRAGRGLLPSPGWDGRYAWDGYADPMLFPYDQDPASGWLGSANQRSVTGGYGVQLSSSWYAPERAERIAELAARPGQDAQTMIAMQYDQTTPLAAKLKAMLQDPALAQPLHKAIAALPDAERARAREALDRLLAFDGRLAAASAAAALYEAFLQESMKQLFLDELGGQDSLAWKALVQAGDLSYSAQQDHLLGRPDSPFWDDLRTPQQEDKPAILARSLAAAVTLCETRMGADRHSWQWGQLHSYTFTSDSTRLALWMNGRLRAAGGAAQNALDRGPYPAGGDFSTLNVSASHWGDGFDAWLVPAMRLVVDFGRDEPMMGQNSTGQSDNPASPHYADGIDAWLKGQYQSFPFQPQHLDHVYGTQRLLLLPP